MKKPQKPKRTIRESTARKEGESGDRHKWRWVDPNSLVINPDFHRLIPLQSKGEYLALSASIKADGCRDPLLIWKGHNVVLDGHTRRDLCLEHNKKVKVVDVELPDEMSAVQFILRLQRQRRNLTREAMSYFRGKEYNALKEKRGGNRPQVSKGQSDPLPTTAQRLADQYGVSEKTIKRDGLFANIIDTIVSDYGDPEVQRHLLGADVRLTQGRAVILYRMSTKDRNDHVKQLLESGELPRAKKAVATTSRQPREVAESLVTRLKSNGDSHARAVLQQMAQLLGMVVSEGQSSK